VHIAKGTELITGTVSFIDFTQGYFRLNGLIGLPTNGLLVRMNDPTARHSIQSGLGCAAGNTSNCSPDVRFAGDPDNYTVSFATGYPACLPSTVTTAFRTQPADASGNGDAFCPATNRAGPVAANSTRFAPIKVGDNVTIAGNREAIGGVPPASVRAPDRSSRSDTTSTSSPVHRRTYRLARTLVWPGSLARVPASSVISVCSAQSRASS
jgi:hypothetical protein